MAVEMKIFTLICYIGCLSVAHAWWPLSGNAKQPPAGTDPLPYWAQVDFGTVDEHGRVRCDHAEQVDTGCRCDKRKSGAMIWCDFHQICIETAGDVRACKPCEETIHRVVWTGKKCNEKKQEEVKNKQQEGEKKRQEEEKKRQEEEKKRQEEEKKRQEEEKKQEKERQEEEAKQKGHLEAEAHGNHRMASLTRPGLDQSDKGGAAAEPTPSSTPSNPILEDPNPTQLKLNPTSEPPKPVVKDPNPKPIPAKAPHPSKHPKPVVENQKSTEPKATSISSPPKPMEGPKSARLKPKPHSSHPELIVEEPEPPRLIPIPPPTRSRLAMDDLPSTQHAKEARTPDHLITKEDPTSIVSEEERIIEIEVGFTEENFTDKMKKDLAAPACEENPGLSFGRKCLPAAYIVKRLTDKLSEVGITVGESTIKCARGVARVALAAGPPVLEGMSHLGAASIAAGGYAVEGAKNGAPYALDGMNQLGAATIAAGSYAVKRAVAAAPYAFEGAKHIGKATIVAGNHALKGAVAAAPQFLKAGAGAVDAAGSAANAIGLTEYNPSEHKMVTPSGCAYSTQELPDDYKFATITQACELQKESEQKVGITCLPYTFIYQRLYMHMAEANRNKARFHKAR